MVTGHALSLGFHHLFSSRATYSSGIRHHYIAQRSRGNSSRGKKLGLLGNCLDTLHKCIAFHIQLVDLFKGYIYFLEKGENKF